MLTVNNKKQYFRLKEKITPNFIKDYYWKFHEWFTKYRILNEKPLLSEHERYWLKSLLIEDVKKMRDITEEKFIEWKDFTI